MLAPPVLRHGCPAPRSPLSAHAGQNFGRGQQPRWCLPISDKRERTERLGFSSNLGRHGGLKESFRKAEVCGICWSKQEKSVAHGHPRHSPLTCVPCTLPPSCSAPWRSKPARHAASAGQSRARRTWLRLLRIGDGRAVCAAGRACGLSFWRSHCCSAALPAPSSRHQQPCVAHLARPAAQECLAHSQPHQTAPLAFPAGSQVGDVGEGCSPQGHGQRGPSMARGLASDQAAGHHCRRH